MRSSSFPVLSSSGVFGANGYDAETKTLFIGDIEVNVPEKPSHEDATRAVA